VTAAGNHATTPILVRKYGGTSIASVDRISAVADDLVACKADGYRLVVVVSAMGHHTDELDHLARSVSDKPARREMDMLLSVGERITMTLLSIALQDRGCPAISFTGSQCGLITDSSHTEAHIIEVKGDRVRAALADDQVVVVAGFQGVSREKEVTTLGRGGSDATAVALAAALDAERCEILKDVDGVFTGDPHRLDGVRRHDTLTYDEMAALADAGCEVVHPRAVAYAREHEVPLFIGSSFREAPGTLVTPLRTDPVAAPNSCGGRYKPLSLVVRDDVGLLDLACPAADFPALRDAAVAATGADLFLGEWLRDGCTEISWCVLMPSSIAADLHETLARLANGATLRFRRGLSCLTLVGRPSTNWLAIHARVQDLLADHDVTGYDLTSDGPILRLLVSPDQAAALQQPLHDVFLAGD
jgi:aspartate kinase